jgi:hypothetical protein
VFRHVGGMNGVKTCAKRRQSHWHQSNPIHEVLNLDFWSNIRVCGKFDLNAIIARVHMSFVGCFKSCRASHELGELWGVTSVEYEPMEEGYRDGVKKRGIDPCHKVF